MLQPSVNELAVRFMRHHPGERRELLQTGKCRTDSCASGSGPRSPEVKLLRKGLEVHQHTPASWASELAWHDHCDAYGYGKDHDCGGQCPPHPMRETTATLVPWARVRTLLQLADAGAELECAGLDLDAAERDHTEHCRRGARTLIARASRLQSQDADAAELEGLRVEILSYRDRVSQQLTPTGRRDLTAAAMRLRDMVEIAGKSAQAMHGPAPVASHETWKAQQATLQTLADFPVDQRPGQTACTRCGQTFIPHDGSTRCSTCDAADADQGDQLGMFDLAPTAPVKTRRAPRAPQPEGLFS